jgi:hypothetical protein
MSNPMLHRQLATITPYILNNLMTVLDTVSSSEQIPSILKILLAISAGYPQLIDASFQVQNREPMDHLSCRFC